MEIFLPNSAHLQNIESIINKIDLTGDKRVVHISGNEKWISLHPAAISLVGSIAYSLQSEGAKVRIEIPYSRSLNYLIRMGFYELLSCKPPKIITEHESSGRFIPLRVVNQSKDIANYINEIIPLLHANPDEVEPIKYVLSELLRNVFEHSGSKCGAIVCAQYYKKTNKVAIGISDAGIGIATSLRRSHKIIDDMDGLHKALTPGVTGVTSKIGGNDYNAGAGLFFTKSIALTSHNYFYIYSGKALFKLIPIKDNKKIKLNANPEEDHATRKSDLPCLKGTSVGIDISVQKSDAFNTTIKNIYDAYNISMKREKKSTYKKARFV